MTKKNKDAPEDESISGQPISMNHYWKVPQEQGMLATLLDLQFKELGFASNSLCLRSQEQLRMHIKI
uniref:Uncharacterized protein n=1 Tax=Rhizophagus irregularis (strain DAOM 181602 / DAOM 197198 / MUCL 43194) TaxID=747089 RepID=U9U0C3_RHIID